ncbi:MAG: TonB-dependent receptor [Bacteroidales bacterium]|nr:TonB-dependent receptor [Bacteroidales bacterium]
MRRIFIYVIFIILSVDFTYSQQRIDTIKLKEIEVRAEMNLLKPITGIFLNTGKSFQIVNFENRTVTYAEKYGRQVFSKIPGVFVYDMDGTGNQVNISIRGLDAHRMWEFNVRKDGIMTNTDIYGYPASHYNLPMEALDRIELIKGTAALQYGAQFGGMLNFITKQPDTARLLAYESSNTLGTYNLISTFHRISGTKGKFAYNIWFAKKTSNGYRKNARSIYDAENITFYYFINKKTKIITEWTHSNYLFQLPGPLTDSMFKIDPKMSTRSRNYYSPSIHVPSIRLSSELSNKLKIEYNISAILGERNSVLFDKPANVPDTINKLTGEYANRQVDRDFYNSFSSELRLMYNYSFWRNENTLLVGVQGINNRFVRKQQGKGTTNNDYDLSLVTEGWGRDLFFKTQNAAIFIENQWVLFKNFSINTGMRYENGESHLSGKIKNYPENELPAKINHKYPLLGSSFSYRINKKFIINGGISQAYRPILLKDITPASIYEKNDKNLKDAYGYVADFSFKALLNTFKFDITSFYIKYNNRMGLNSFQDTSGNYFVIRKNIGNSISKGIELFVEKQFEITQKYSIVLYSSTSYIDARYKDAVIRSGNTNINIDGNKVESAPEWITRNNVTVRINRIFVSFLYSYVSETFADPLNTKAPSPSGSVGIVPSYHLFDGSVAWQINNHFHCSVNINNIFDKAYFTKRPQLYPGPGVWPSDGRTVSVTLKYSL